MKKKFNSFKEIINNLKSTARGKAVLFFSCYLIFFIILFIIISSSSRTILGGEFEKSHNGEFDITKITNNNYTYKYSINIDVLEHDFLGERTNYLELFEYNNNEYFKNNEDKIIYINDNNKWIVCDNPNGFDYFTNIDNIKKLVESSTYISKTDYESGKQTYNYEISTTTIEKIKNNVDIDLDDKPNEIVFSTDEEGNVNKIKLNLDSYGKYNKICIKYFSIELEYDNFGKIDDIKNPIVE